jgi:putative restriction endonuclease
MKIYLGVTDNEWFDFLSQQVPIPEDINFWQPGGKTNFKAIPAGAPFLFKLKGKRNAIGGVGFFSSHTFLPLSLAWDTFGTGNGCANLDALRNSIQSYREDRESPNPVIGCIVLTNPVFFAQEDWIPAPENWANSIVQGKGYDTEDRIGSELWARVESLLKQYMPMRSDTKAPPAEWLVRETNPGYREVLTRVRKGQGAFRIDVLDGYQRRCAITGEKTLPVLEAAHIKEYSKSGPHSLRNGILLRSDMHKLFDDGYLTVTPDLHVEVSGRIREEFQNGKEYYQFHGKELAFLPTALASRPDPAYIDWHNTNVFKS